MTPSLPLHDQLCGADGNAEVTGQVSVRDAHGEVLAHLAHQLLCELRLGMPKTRSFPGLPAAMATLRMHVGHVVALRAEKQVARVAARWVVAAVQHLRLRWNAAVGDRPSESMGNPALAKRRPFPAVSPIPVPIGSTDPRPARVITRTRNLGPKSLDVLFVHNSELTHFSRVRKADRTCP